MRDGRHSISHVLMGGAAFAAFLALPVLASAQTVLTTPDEYPALTNEWSAAGSVGSTFGSDQFDNAHVDFSGNLTYLRQGMFGGEFLAGFAPNQAITRLGGIENDINNYMVNAIGAVPFGEEGNFQPFVSGGFGLLTSHSSASDAVQASLGTTDLNDTEPGANIGFGLMGFQNQWGFRTEVRYFSQLGTASSNPLGIPQDLTFWRANAGVSYRW
jgi:hypothetical protein